MSTQATEATLRATTCPDQIPFGYEDDPHYQEKYKEQARYGAQLIPLIDEVERREKAGQIVPLLRRFVGAVIKEIAAYEAEIPEPIQLPLDDAPGRKPAEQVLRDAQNRVRTACQPK